MADDYALFDRYLSGDTRKDFAGLGKDVLDEILGDTGPVGTTARGMTFTAIKDGAGYHRHTIRDPRRLYRNVFRLWGIRPEDRAVYFLLDHGAKLDKDILCHEKRSYLLYTTASDFDIRHHKEKKSQAEECAKDDRSQLVGITRANHELLEIHTIRIQDNDVYIRSVEGGDEHKVIFSKRIAKKGVEKLEELAAGLLEKRLDAGHLRGLMEDITAIYGIPAVDPAHRSRIARNAYIRCLFDIKRSGDMLQARIAKEIMGVHSRYKLPAIVSHDHLAVAAAMLYGVPAVLEEKVGGNRMYSVFNRDPSLVQLAASSARSQEEEDEVIVVAGPSTAPPPTSVGLAWERHGWPNYADVLHRFDRTMDVFAAVMRQAPVDPTNPFLSAITVAWCLWVSCVLRYHLVHLVGLMGMAEVHPSDARLGKRLFWIVNPFLDDIGAIASPYDGLGACQRVVRAATAGNRLSTFVMADFEAIWGRIEQNAGNVVELEWIDGYIRESAASYERWARIIEHGSILAMGGNSEEAFSPRFRSMMGWILRPEPAGTPFSEYLDPSKGTKPIPYTPPYDIATRAMELAPKPLRALWYVVVKTMMDVTQAGGTGWAMPPRRSSRSKPPSTMATAAVRPPLRTMPSRTAGGKRM